MKLIVISSHKPVEDEGRIINELFSGGLEIFHIRKPGYSLKELESLIMRISPAFHPHIVLHSHYSLVKKYKLRGIHIPSRKRTNAIESFYWYYRHRLLSPSFHISTSFHRTNEFIDSKRNYHYVLLSPVFRSISKSHYLPLYSESEMKNAVARSRNKVIALGGISMETVRKVFEIGFHGMALMGTIWTSPDPVESFAAIRKKVIELSDQAPGIFHNGVANNGAFHHRFQKS